MLIRTAAPADIDDITALWFALNRTGNKADPRYRLSRTAGASMKETLGGWASGGRPTWVAEIEGGLVGVVSTKPAAAHPVLDLPKTLVVTDLYVNEANRRCGVGPRLFEAVQSYAVANGVAAVEVGTLALDRRAVAFWRSQGFEDWRVTLSGTVAPV